MERMNCLGENRNRTAHLNWPRGYSILYDIMWKNYKSEGSSQGGIHSCSVTGWASVSGWWEIVFLYNLFCLYIHIFVIIALLLSSSSSTSSLLFLLSVCVLANSFTSAYKFYLFLSFQLYPPSHREGGEWKAVWCSAASWINPQLGAREMENGTALKVPAEGPMGLKRREQPKSSNREVRANPRLD